MFHINDKKNDLYSYVWHRIPRYKNINCKTNKNKYLAIRMKKN